VLVALVTCGGEGKPPPAAPEEEAQRTEGPTFVGGESCVSCHPKESERWSGSHHDLAMQPATPETVLGDFDDASFTHFEVTSTFSRRDGGFVVRTDGPDGRLRDYEVAYTFGVDPLQQYLVAFPDGRLQALGLAWDTRPREQGGQRWFHLYPDEPIPHDDVLHWTGLQQNWNHMCAECHSTNVRKRYRPEPDRFETAWSEIDVACEACHGPGSTHVALAQAKEAGELAEVPPDFGLTIRFAEAAEWVFEPNAAIARRTGPRGPDTELETCGRCHSRRAQLREEPVRGQPLLATHRVALLDAGLYHADGQILDEVYVYGSFVQSRMHRAGVTCGDCHDAHSLAIEGAPDAICLRCHRVDVYTSFEHHHHKADSPGASCVECHMAARNYMVIDARHDHSFRSPRPDLTLKIGTPNACTTPCHEDRDVLWAEEAVESWRGGPRPDPGHFGEALRAGRERLPEAERALAELAGNAEQPAIARATALKLLGPLLGFESVDAVRAALLEPDPLLRMAALTAAEALEPRARLLLAKPLLMDPVRAVRLEAERVLRAVPPSLWKPRDLGPLARVRAEFRAVQRLHADRPEAWLNLGLLDARLGEIDAARADYERALRIAPWFMPAYVNLADLYRQAERDDEGERVLRRALERAPESPDVHHALGLLLVRRGLGDEAIAALGRAAELAPERPRYGYVHAVALHSDGDSVGALRALEETHRRFPAHRDTLRALVSIHRERGASSEATRYARKLAALAPGDPRVRSLLEVLERSAAPE
jgi:tetratricopeptide (TPR) repeat protein